MDASRRTVGVSKPVPIRRPDSPVRGLLELASGLDASMLAAIAAVAAGSLGGRDLAEPLRLGAAAAWAWLAMRG